jgi:hypothetical protein
LDKIPSGVRLFNVIITYPTIQNLTISSKSEEILGSLLKNIIPEKLSEKKESEIIKANERMEATMSLETLTQLDNVISDEKLSSVPHKKISQKKMEKSEVTESPEKEKKARLIPSDHSLKRKFDLPPQKNKQKSNKTNKSNK